MIKDKQIIRWLKVKGLNTKVDADMVFKQDLNIITGANGSGKTTLLKLMWYLISGQIDRALYLTFDHVSIGTDQFELFISSYQRQDEFQIKWTFDKDAFRKLDDSEPDDSEPDDSEPDDKPALYVHYFEDAEEDCRSLNEDIAEKMESSLFFPSFRRIEGGFSQQIPQDARSARQTKQTRRRGGSVRAQITEESPLQNAMSEMSANRSIDDHKFVTSYSTTDIVELLLQKEIEISKEINAIHADFLRDLSGKIPSDSTKELQEANSILKQINDNLTEADSAEQKLRNPLTSLNSFIDVIFDHGITIAESFTLGDKRNAIPSERLSSGGKQMLSFLCYNAFSNNDTTIFIDEPELSLHQDWQDILLPLLLKQATGNQFFVATHSELIYNQFPNNEFILEELEEN